MSRWLVGSSRISRCGASSVASSSDSRLAKLNEMRDKLAQKLADPALYHAEAGNQAEPWQRKYAEVMNALDRAEALWVAAQEKLEKAEKTAPQTSE